MIFLCSLELFSYLNEVMDQKLKQKGCSAVEVNISTYGLSLHDEKMDYGNGEGYSEDTLAKKFIKKLHGTRTKMLVGIPPQKRFNKQDYGLWQNDYYKKAGEILEIGNTYGIHCVPSDSLHFKFYRIDDIYITGGINFGNSMWNDCSVLVEDPEDKQRLQFLFDCSWQGATEVHPVITECSVKLAAGSWY